MARPKTLKDRRAVTLYLEGPQKAALDRMAEKLGRPWAEIVREAIDVMLARHKKQR
jgi:predicted DNA-binding protein